MDTDKAVNKESFLIDDDASTIHSINSEDTVVLKEELKLLETEISLTKQMTDMMNGNGHEESTEAVAVIRAARVSMDPTDSMTMKTTTNQNIAEMTTTPAKTPSKSTTEKTMKMSDSTGTTTTATKTTVKETVKKGKSVSISTKPTNSYSQMTLGMKKPNKATTKIGTPKKGILCPDPLAATNPRPISCYLQLKMPPVKTANSGNDSFKAQAQAFADVLNGCVGNSVVFLPYLEKNSHHPPIRSPLTDLRQYCRLSSQRHGE